VSKIAVTPGLVAVGCLIPVSSWWFMQIDGLPAAGIDNASLQAVQAILLLQFLSVCLFSPQWAANSQSAQRFAFVEAGASVAAFVVPAWPLLAMLALASEVSAGEFAVAEAAVLITGILIASISQGIEHLALGKETTRLSQILLGLVAATLVWVFRPEWFHWIGL